MDMADAPLTSLDARPRGTRCSPRVRLRDDRAERQSDDFRLLANPIRLQLLYLLLEETGPVCVCDLTGALALKQPTVSHHLKLLKDAGIVDSEKRGVWSYWFVKRDALARLKRRVSESLEALE
jgi:ArsR family transcriptional regulator, arsenate/arsenite/antimonite-responsive transcriptional repressor